MTVARVSLFVANCQVDQVHWEFQSCGGRPRSPRATC